VQKQLTTVSRFSTLSNISSLPYPAFLAGFFTIPILYSPLELLKIGL
jgi:hypothetical protein